MFPPFEFLPMLEKVADSLMRARGVILGKATLMECRKLTPEDRSAALCNIDPSGYGWVLRDPVIFDEFVPRRGQQGLFEVEWPPPAEGKC